MRREVSVYLDLLRFLAALAVFLQHFAWQHFSGGMLWQIEPYGAQAVVVFFVLSGYLIGYVTHRPGATARGYILDRAARLYSVVLPALFLTFVLDAIGKHIHPEMFTGGWFNGTEPIISQFIRNALFLNQIWFSNTYPGSNVPYWSMGYEAWYYIIFGLFAFLPRVWGALAALAALACVGPGVAELFPIWLLGVAVYQLHARGIPGRHWLGISLFLGAPLVWLALEVWLRQHGMQAVQPLSARGWERWQHLCFGVVMAAHLLGVYSVAPWIGRALAPCERVIRWLAARSFTLYLMQMPILQFLLVVLPVPATSWLGRGLLLSGTLGSVLLLAELTERRKAPWRRMFGQVMERIVPEV